MVQYSTRPCSLSGLNFLDYTMRDSGAIPMFRGSWPAPEHELFSASLTALLVPWRCPMELLGSASSFKERVDWILEVGGNERARHTIKNVRFCAYSRERSMTCGGDNFSG